ncbi:MAG: PfkB family carbohydrate kinase [Solirubrobacteraceae bacterium]
MTSVAVVGHVEWVDFLRVARYPPRGGLQQATREFAHAGGGAVVAAATLAWLGAKVDFFCALGDDQTGHTAAEELSARGISVHAAWRDAATRSVFTLLDDGGERTIVTVGERLQPAGDDPLEWDRLHDADGAYLTAGDAGAADHARAARVLVATPRVCERLHNPSLAIDALVFSASDRDEVRWAQDLASRTRLMVATDGEDGGRWWGESEGRWAAVAPPGDVRDSYGCGDAFAAGFTFGLAQGLSPGEAAAVGARCGAEMLTRVGAP